MAAALDECIAVAAAAGHAPDGRSRAGWRAWVTDPRSTFSSSMLRDTERGGRIEADHIVGDMLARAAAARLDTPLLRIIDTHVQAYQARRRRESR
jgi:2-dehydropantoate 2-reductase